MTTTITLEAKVTVSRDENGHVSFALKIAGDPDPLPAAGGEDWGENQAAHTIGMALLREADCRAGLS